MALFPVSQDQLPLPMPPLLRRQDTLGPEEFGQLFRREPIIHAIEEPDHDDRRWIDVVREAGWVDSDDETEYEDVPTDSDIESDDESQQGTMK